MIPLSGWEEAVLNMPYQNFVIADFMSSAFHTNFDLSQIQNSIANAGFSRQHVRAALTHQRHARETILQCPEIDA